MIDDSLTLDDFRAMLRLQEVDTTIDQATAKRESLPSHAVLEDVQKSAGALRPQLIEATAERDRLQREQDSIEADVVVVEKRIAEINARLYDGSAKIAPNDALAMTQEVRHLHERRKKFEDDELEIMEQLEVASAVVAPLDEQAQSLAAKMRQANIDIGLGQQQIDAELIGLHEIRSKAVSDVPASLLAEYEKIRLRLGGLAAVPLVGSACGGCHLSMASTEVARIHKAPPSSLIQCEECDRILVRV